MPHVKLCISSPLPPPKRNDISYSYGINVSKNKFSCEETIADSVVNQREKDVLINCEIVDPTKNVAYDRVIVKNNELLFLAKNNRQKPSIWLSVEKQPMSCIIDSGSDRTILKYERLKEIDKNAHIKESNLKVRGLSGVTPVVGESDISLKIKNKSIKVSALVIKDLKFKSDMLFGNDLLYQANAIINYEMKYVKLGNEKIPFIGTEGLRFNNEDCLVTEFNNYRRQRRKRVSKTNVKAPHKDESCNVEKSEEIKSPAESNVVKGRSKDKTKGAVHVLTEVVIPAHSMKAIKAYCKVRKGTYFVKKRSLNSGIQVADCLVSVESDNGTVPVAILNTTENDIIVSEGTILSSVEKTNGETYTVLCNDISEEINLRQKEKFNDVRIKPQNVVQSVTISDKKCRALIDQAGEKIAGENSASGIGNVDSYSSLCTRSISCENLEFKCTSNKLNVKCEKNAKVNTGDAVTAPSHICFHKQCSSLQPDVLRSNGMPECMYCEERINVAPITLKDRNGPITLDDITIEEDVPKNIAERLRILLNNYRLVCAKPGERAGIVEDFSYRINLINDKLTINVPPYRIAHKFEAMLNVELEKLKESGIIRESCSAYNAPVICVKKPDGTIRICIDYRKLNNNIELHTFVLPNINEIINSLGGAKIFTTLDLKSAFHQIPLEENSRRYTAFSVNQKKFEYNCLPFGLATSPSIYQSYMSKILGDLLGVVAYCYIDDIILYSRNHEEHLESIEKILERLNKAKLTLRLEKCVFFRTKIKYLGHVISQDGITCPDSFKLKDCPRPFDKKSLQQFLGLANFYRKFVPLFSVIAHPLYRLLQINVPFDWTENCEAAFQKLKEKLNIMTTLAHPNFKRDFVLFTDASNTGIGACLAQEGPDGKLRPLSYFSKTLSKTQVRYCTTKKEALGVVSALKHFQYIITGYHCIICTDHRPLTSIFSKNLPTDTALARWCLSIQSFNLTLKYYPGKLNVVADYLSRIPTLFSDIEKAETLAQADESNEIIDNDNINFHDESNTLVSDSIRPLTPYIPTLDEVSWSLDELIKEQANDDFCINIKEQFYGKHNDPNIGNIGQKNLDQFLFIGDILYKRRKIDDKDTVVLNIVIPTSLMPKAIKAVHYISHGDKIHTLFKFKFRFYHQYENRHVQKFVEACDVCKILKGKAPKPIKLRKAPIASRPFEHVSIDILGPLPRTDEGNRYILSIIDLFSRFCVLKALRTKETAEIINCLRETFNYFGFPNVLLSDNALEFTSSALHQFSSIYSVKKTTVLPFCPYSNGTVETNNRKINQLLKLYVHSTELGEWDDYLLTVSNVLNNSLNISIGDTPAFCCLGYDTCPNLNREDLQNVYNYDSPESLVTLREKRASYIRDHIRKNIQSSREMQHLYSNKRKADRKIEIGDRVIFKNHSKANKLDLNYIGPAVVTQVVNNHKLTLKLNNKIYDRVNINHCILLKHKSRV